MALKTYETVSSNDYGAGASWSGGTIPGAGDDVALTMNATSILSGLNQSGVAIDLFQQFMDFTGLIGQENTYLQIDANRIELGVHRGTHPEAGSRRINIDQGNNAADLICYDTAAGAADRHFPPVRYLCNNVGSNVEVRGGRLGIAVDAGETATLGEARVGGSQRPSAILLVGEGVTATTLLAARGGTMITAAGATTLTALEGSRVVTDSDAAFTTLNARGHVEVMSTGTIATLNAEMGCVLDFRKSRGLTVTDFHMRGGTYLGLERVTITNKITHPTDRSLTINVTEG